MPAARLPQLARLSLEPIPLQTARLPDSATDFKIPLDIDTRGGGQFVKVKNRLIRPRLEVFMSRKRMLMSVGFVLALVAVVLSGFWLGHVFGNQRAQERQTARRAALTLELREHSRGISIGSPPPTGLAWSVTGDTVLEFKELLPAGGVILLVSPGCDLCVGAAEKLQQSLSPLHLRSTHAVLLADRAAGSEDLSHALEKHSIGLKVYCDLQEVFRRECGVMANPAYFILNKAGAVLDIGAGVPDKSRLAVLLSQR